MKKFGLESIAGRSLTQLYENARSESKGGEVYMTAEQIAVSIGAKVKTVSISLNFCAENERIPVGKRKVGKISYYWVCSGYDKGAKELYELYNAALKEHKANLGMKKSKDKIVSRPPELIEHASKPAKTWSLQGMAIHQPRKDDNMVQKFNRASTLLMEAAELLEDISNKLRPLFGG